MDLESEFLVGESVEDNGEITNGSVSQNLKNIAESNHYKNGSVVGENGNGHGDELLPDWKKEAEFLASVNSISADLRPEQEQEQSSSVARTKKGSGLRKWRRIKRDPNKGGDSSIDAGKMMMQDILEPAINPSKRMLVNGDQKQKSEGSVSSTNAVVGRLGDFARLDDSGFALGFAAGTDSDNSEHQSSSRSSTAASAPKKKYETGVVRSLNGKNLMSTNPRAQLGKGKIETTKKVRWEPIKIEKENSHSSMESDSRSSNFVFLQGTYSSGNGTRNERPMNGKGENSEEATQGSQQEVSNGRHGDYGRDGGEEYDDVSHEGIVADSSWEAKEDRNQDSSPRDHDILVDSIFSLQSAQDALEREVLMFRDVGKDISVYDAVPDLHTEFLVVEQSIQDTISEHLPSGMAAHSLPRTRQSNIAGEADRYMDTEFEGLFKQKIEAELEYLVISRAVENLRFAFVEQITNLEEQKDPTSKQTHSLDDNVQIIENKAAMKEAEKLGHGCEDIARADEILHLQKSVWKYGSCFFFQLVVLIAIVTIFIYRLLPNHVALVPT